MGVVAASWLRFPRPGEEAAPAPDWPLEAVLDGVAAAGFGAVGLDHYTLGGREADVVAAELRARGLRCSDIGIVRLGELEQPDVERLAATARALDARLCVAALHRPLPHEEIVRDLRAAATVLAPGGVRLAFEFTSYGHPVTLAEGAAICDAVGRHRCGLLVDAWHVFRGGESLADVAALGDDRIALVHVGDGAAKPLADALLEGRFHRLAPGEGAFDLGGFFEALGAAGYAGPVGVEVLSEELRSLPPAEGARRLRAATVRLRSPSRPGRASRGTRQRLRPRRSS